MANQRQMAREADPVVGADALDRHEPGGQDDVILQEHLEKALDKAESGDARYHLRAALQRFEFE
jgi:hypothetical protein